MPRVYSIDMNHISDTIKHVFINIDTDRLDIKIYS